MFLTTEFCSVDVNESDFGLGLVDGEHVEFLVLLDGLVDLVRLVALARAPLLDVGNLQGLLAACHLPDDRVDLVGDALRPASSVLLPQGQRVLEKKSDHKGFILVHIFSCPRGNCLTDSFPPFDICHKTSLIFTRD